MVLSIQSRNVLFVLLWMVSSTMTYGQSSVTDLLAQLDTIQNDQSEMEVNDQIISFYDNQNLKADTTLVHIIVRQAFLHWKTDPQTLDSLAGVALQLSNDLDYAYGQAEAIFMQGFYLDLSGSFDEALIKYFDARERYSQLNRPSNIARANEYIGIVYRFMGDYEQSLKHFLLCLTQYEKLNDSLRIGNSLNSIGNLYYDQGDYQTAADYYESALILKRRFNSPNSIASTLGNLASIYAHYDRLDESLSIAKEVLAIKLQENNLQDAAIAYAKLGDVYDKMNRYDLAEESLKKAIEIDYQIENYHGLAGDLRYLGHFIRKQGRYDEAYRILDSADKYSRITHAPLNLKSVYEERVVLDTLIGDFQSAFYDLVSVLILDDSLVDLQLARAQAKMEADFEFNKERDSINFVNQQEKAILETEIDFQQKANYFIITGLVLVSILAIIIYWLYRSKHMVNTQLSQLNQAIQLQNVEISNQKKALEKAIYSKQKLYTMIAHDLRGPVNTFLGTGYIVDALLEDGEYDELRRFSREIEQKSIQLTQLLDNLLKWAKEHQTEFSYQPVLIEVAEVVHRTLKLYRYLAESKQVTLQTEIEEDIRVWADPNSFEGILRNLVNNAIKFTEAGGSIAIKTLQTDEETVLSIRDTGLGMTQEQIDKILKGEMLESQQGTLGEQGTGLGLNLVCDFVKLNNARLNIESKVGEGTSFHIQFAKADQNG
jgi:signal transduction histidine kinase